MVEKVKRLQKSRKADIKHGKVNLAVFDNHQTSRANEQEHQQKMVVESLKKAVEKSNKEIVELKMKLGSGKSLVENTDNLRQLQLEKNNLERALAEKNMFLEEAKSNLRVKGELFKQSKSYENTIYTDYQRKIQENNELEIQNRTLEAAQSREQDLNDRLAKVRTERNTFE